jgi:hypothetical protein
MRKIDEICMQDSCLNKAHDNEWLFVFLGRDLAATVAVEAWIAERIRIEKMHQLRDLCRVLGITLPEVQI